MPEFSQENETSKKKVEYRITAVEFATMLIFGILFDLLGLIPFVNVAIIFFAQCLFALVFWANGVKILEKKKLVTFLAASVIEVIPLLSMLPGITLEVIIISVISRMEDELRAAAQNQIKAPAGNQLDAAAAPS